MTTQANSSLAPSRLTIGVFDSGFGGLTVLRALLPLIPGARFLYLGDTARLPYGSKSHETIARYAVSSARFLHQQGAQLLVIACNTASAVALNDIELALPIPVIGVIQPGAHAAAVSKNQGAISHSNNKSVIPSTAKNPRILLEQAPISPSGNVLVLATAATVQSRAYTQALNDLGLEATEKACPLLVPLVEEGWTDHHVTDDVLKIYLTEALAVAPGTSTLLLGCTHYPLLEPAIHRTLEAIGHPLRLIDSAEATAQATAALVATHFPKPNTADQSTCTFYATDSVEKFQRLGSSFLGQPVSEVNLIDLGG